MYKAKSPYCLNVLGIWTFSLRRRSGHNKNTYKVKRAQGFLSSESHLKAWSVVEKT